MTPPGSAPNTPLKGSPGSGQPLSAPPRLPSTPVNPASISLPANHPYLMSPPASEVKEDERARNYIYQIEGKVRESKLQNFAFHCRVFYLTWILIWVLLQV